MLNFVSNSAFLPFDRGMTVKSRAQKFFIAFFLAPPVRNLKVVKFGKSSPNFHIFSANGVKRHPASGTTDYLPSPLPLPVH